MNPAIEPAAGHDGYLLFLSLGLLLASAHILGELAKRFHMPSVVGEIFAGVLLGPTVLGGVAPVSHDLLFPQTGIRAGVLDGLTTISIAMFLLVAGMEVDLSNVWKQGRTAALVGIAGLLVPFALGASLGWVGGEFLGTGHPTAALLFPLFLGTALSISALPVIARTLLDLKLYRTDFGMIVMPAAILQDVIGWCVFAVILGMMGVGNRFTVGQTVALTLVFAAFSLTLVRWGLNRCLPWLMAHCSWPGGVIALGISLALLGAAFTEWIGIHAVFGAFLIGIALGDSKHVSERTRFTFETFISFFFAPLFFASIGLRVDFISHFDGGLVALIFIVATVGKLVGCWIGATMAGLGRRDAVAIGFAMNARGAMEIILGLLALEYGIITKRMFVALVIMAIGTSLLSGPLIQRVLRLKRSRSFMTFSKPNAFRVFDGNVDFAAVVRELTRALATSASIDAEAAFAAVMDREMLMRTGIGNGLAVPHARVAFVKQPIVAIGIVPTGVKCDSPDGLPAHIIILTVGPSDNGELQLALFADIARTFSDRHAVQDAMVATTHTEFLAAVKNVRAG